MSLLVHKGVKTELTKFSVFLQFSQALNPDWEKLASLSLVKLTYSLLIGQSVDMKLGITFPLSNSIHNKYITFHHNFKSSDSTGTFSILGHIQPERNTNWSHKVINTLYKIILLWRSFSLCVQCIFLRNLDISFYKQYMMSR
jgi:hypothetical protein